MCCEFKMIVLKITVVFLLALTVGAEKKIELQDIEDDNLRSEKGEEHVDHSAIQQNSGPETAIGLPPIDVIKSNILRYFDSPAPGHQRHAHQYAVTEPPESPPVLTSQHYKQPVAPQQALVGYLSNMPMQVYLVPQYHSEKSEGQDLAAAPRYNTYQASNAIVPQPTYVESSRYLAPTEKPYTHTYAAPVAYVNYPVQPNIQHTPQPIMTYQVPVIQYSNPAAQPTAAAPTYYQSSQREYQDLPAVDDVQEYEYDHKHYTPTENPYAKNPKESASHPRHYHSREPIREEYGDVHGNVITELPSPKPILLKPAPAHLAHLPKTLPMYRPVSQHVYRGGPAPPIVLPPRTHDHGWHHSPPLTRRPPTSLLDSYIPSSVQYEYLKRGIVKDPLVLYEALSTGRLPYPIHRAPRQYERGFLPNQMYPTAAGGVRFGHVKRTQKVDKPQR